MKQDENIINQNQLNRRLCQDNPKVPHTNISVCFTVDEEIGEGPLHFNYDEMNADFAYTIDGADIDVEKITLDTDIMTGLGVNSIGLVYLVVAIERVFDIDMSDVTFNTFKVVGDVVDYIEERVK